MIASLLRFLKGRQRQLMMAVGIAVTVGALWFSTRNVRFRDVAAAFGSYRLVWLLPALAAFYFSMYLRAVRWGLLFEPHHRLKGRRVFRPLMICFAFNCILPGRVGEVARAYLVARDEKTGLPTALATVVAERILDAVTLLSCLMISLQLLPPMDKSLVYPFGKINLTADKLNELLRHLIELSAILTAGAIVFIIPATQNLVLWLARHNPLLPRRWNHAIERLTLQFAQGFHALRRPWPLAQIVLHSIVIWILVAASNAVAARGLGLQMTLVQGMALMTLIGIFILIPAAPGYWGLYEAGAIFSLKFMGIGRDDSERLAYALIIHLLQYVPIVALGLYYAWRARVRPAALGEGEGPGL